MQEEQGLMVSSCVTLLTLLITFQNLAMLRQDRVN